MQAAREMINAPDDEDLRERALASIKKKREFVNHIAAYVLVNATLVVIWAITDAGFFWPVFPMLFWGIGVFFHGLDTYSGGPNEQRIQREMDRLR